MAISPEDIKRAIIGGGEVSSIAEIYQQALGNTPVPILPRMDTPRTLPDPELLAGPEGRLLRTAGFQTTGPARKGELPLAGIELTLVATAPFGKNIHAYLSGVIESVHPDILAIDSCPLELSAAILYTFSLPCALGLPFNGDIIRRDSGEVYLNTRLYPGSPVETAIFKSWAGKIPLIAAGPPPEPVQLTYMPNQGLVDVTYPERARWSSLRFSAHRHLDDLLRGSGDLREINLRAAEISRQLAEAAGEPGRENLLEESCYISSRIMDIAAACGDQGRRTRLLALIDISRYHDVEYIIQHLRSGLTDEIYVPRRQEINQEETLLVENRLDNLNATAPEYSADSTQARETFLPRFREAVKARETEALSRETALKLVAEIAGRTRTHPEIVRGVSVRGAIAFQEVLEGLAEMHGSLTRESITKAALITLPSRISLKEPGREKNIIADITREVLYNLRFSAPPGEAEKRVLNRLSAGDILEKLDRLETASALPEQEINLITSPVVVTETEKNREALKRLEEMQYIKKDSRGEYSLTRKALEFLLNELEQKLQAGEITPESYSQQKAGLMAKLKKISEPEFQMSTAELASTIMEMMDAQDRQWNPGVDFRTLQVYYHIKENSEGAELSPQKRDYHALKRLINDLEKRKVLAAAGDASTFTLTGLALEILFKYLMESDSRPRQLQGFSSSGREPAFERRQEVRRYSSGDVFRDISVRHTLRQVVKQKKALAEVRNRDFRVFLKETRRPRYDILLCLDISGSMGFSQKLLYARLAAAGLVQAALKEGNRVGIVAFNDYGQITQPLTGSNREALLNCIGGLTARGNTNMGDGLKAAGELLLMDSSRNRKYIILISDGQPTAVSEKTFSQLKTVEQRDLTEESALLEVRQAAARGIRVSAIHIAGKGEPSDIFMKKIARAGQGKVHRISGPDDLKTLLC